MAGTLNVNQLIPDQGQPLYLNGIDYVANVVVGNATTALLTITPSGNVISLGTITAAGISTPNGVFNFPTVNVINANAANVVTTNVYATNVITSNFFLANLSSNNVVSNKIYVNGTSSDVYDLDDISYAADGRKNTFNLTYNQTAISANSPFNLMVTVNGLVQPAFDYKYDTFWLANVLTASKGYCLDNSGNIKFADSPPQGSQILIRTVFGSLPANKKVYPFKPLDIVMGY